MLEMIGKEEFERFNCTKNDDRCMEIADNQRKRVTDEQAKKLMQRFSGCDIAAKFQALPMERREKALRKMLEAGVSIRQASRITGVSFGVVRKYV